MWLPKLEFIGRDCSLSECENIRYFLERNLAIESFRLNLAHSPFKPEDVKLWVLVAISHYLRELDILYHAYPDKPNILPRSLYTSKSLVTLNLEGKILLDVPRMVSMSSLTTLQLREVIYFDGESLGRLLSICPILKDLLLDFSDTHNMGMITVIVPYLQSLSIYIPYDGLIDGLKVDTPSLKYFKIENYNDENHSCLIEDMPKLEEAYVDVFLPDLESLIGSILSIKRLTIASEAVYVGGFVFNDLEHLKLCVGSDYAANLLVRLLEGSPNLR
ncbi:FBD-associated F-box protein At4g10400-like, partial [Arabidopsis lyrata subsp. lyrata]